MSELIESELYGRLWGKKNPYKAYFSAAVSSRDGKNCERSLECTADCLQSLNEEG